MTWFHNDRPTPSMTTSSPNSFQRLSSLHLFSPVVETAGSSFLRTIAGLALALLPSCTTLTTEQTDATALTRYTWQVDYSVDPLNARGLRHESFASTTLLNRNGEKPTGAVTGPDDQGLWWGALPPRPTIDDVEQRQQMMEKPGTPQLIKSVEYRIQFQQQGDRLDLPTNFDVYREVVKSKRTGAKLTLTLGLNEKSVEKAEPTQ